MALDSPAARLRWARQRFSRYRTATEAARAFGWNVSTYLGHENGDRTPSRETAKRYGRAYHVRWEWILEGEGSPQPPKRADDERYYPAEPPPPRDPAQVEEVIRRLVAELGHRPPADERAELDAIWARLGPAQRKTALRMLKALAEEEAA